MSTSTAFQMNKPSGYNGCLDYEESLKNRFADESENSSTVGGTALDSMPGIATGPTQKDLDISTRVTSTFSLGAVQIATSMDLWLALHWDAFFHAGPKALYSPIDDDGHGLERTHVLYADLVHHPSGQYDCDRFVIEDAFVSRMSDDDVMRYKRYRKGNSGMAFCVVLNSASCEGVRMLKIIDADSQWSGTAVDKIHWKDTLLAFTSQGAVPRTMAPTNYLTVIRNSAAADVEGDVTMND